MFPPRSRPPRRSLSRRLAARTRAVARRHGNPAAKIRDAAAGGGEDVKRGAIVVLLLAFAASAEERTITPAGAGANRLDLDTAVMARAQPLRYADAKTFEGGLDDLRIYDAAHREVPYLLVAPDTSAEEWVTAKVLPIVATKKTSGREADFGSRRVLDRIRVSRIATPFLKRVRVEGSGDREHWTLLVADATIFDLPSDKLSNATIAFEPGEYRYIRITF